MKRPKQIKCPSCGRKFYPTIGYANHVAMHGREAELAEKYGWSQRHPFKANRK